METANECEFHRERLRWALTLLEQARESGNPRAMKTAEHRVAAVRADAARVAGAAAKRLHTLQDSLALMRSQTPATPEEARRLNERHREASAAIGEAAAALAAFGPVLNAAATRDLGGPSDLDTVSFGVPATRADTLTRRVAAVVALVALVSLFLPWLYAGGASGSLVAIGRVLLAAGLVRPPVPPVLHVVPVAALLIVGSGAALAALARQSLATVWAVIACGCAALAMAFFPAALVLSRADTLLDYMAAGRLVGPGAWLYALCGMMLVYLGSRSRDALLDKNGYPVLAAVATVLITVAVFVLLGVAVAAAPRGGDVRFNPAWSEDNPGILDIPVRNQSDGTIALYAPAPTGGTSTRHPWYGVSLYARETPGNPFRALPEGAQVWSVAGAAREMPLLLNPGATAILRLDTGALRQNVGSLDTVRLLFLRAGGRVIAEFTAPMPPPADIVNVPENIGRVPLETIRNPEVQTEEMEPAPLPEPVVTEAAPVAIAPPAAPPEPAGWPVTLRGVIGEQGAFVVTRPGTARPDRVTAQIGDEVISGWVVRGMTLSPASAELEHRASGRIQLIRRGDTLALQPDL